METSLADVVRQHGPGYLARFGRAILPSHVRALRDIDFCRTGKLGGQLAECVQCGRRHVAYHSCRNRPCPRCGRDVAARWMTRQRELLLPVRYYHVVFTLPDELRRFVRCHQLALLAELFRSAFESLQALCNDPRFVDGKIGALAVLHTWSRTLQWHPHIHMLVPGGGVAPDGRTWRAARNDSFLVPVRALAKLFRARFLARARSALPNVKLPEVPWDKPWVVFAKPVVQGADKVIEYLGRYVHRTAITDKSIVANRNGAISFAYRESLTNRRRRMTLPAHEFLRRFLQHVPPRRLHRVRSFGLLHRSHRVTLRRLQLLLGMWPPVADPETPPTRARCAYCPNAALRMLRKLSVSECERQLRLGAVAIGAKRVDAISRGPPSGPQSVVIAN